MKSDISCRWLFLCRKVVRFCFCFSSLRLLGYLITSLACVFQTCFSYTSLNTAQGTAPLWFYLILFVVSGASKCTMTSQHLLFQVLIIFFFHSLCVELYPFSSLDSFILFPLSISVDKYSLQLDLVCMYTGVTIQV